MRRSLDIPNKSFLKVDTKMAHIKTLYLLMLMSYAVDITDNDLVQL